MCEIEVPSSNVSWHHVERGFEVQNSSRFSIYTVMLNMTSVSRFTIYNITQEDAGGFPASKSIRARKGIKGSERIKLQPV